MGNEKSSPAGLKIVDTIKVSDDWIQKSAIISNDLCKICVFEQYLKEENVQHLKNFSKNLKLYRHPNILKYISSWRTNKTLFVATEFGEPLSLVIRDLQPMQVCVGLYSILKAIIFLHENASSSHNNISIDAVYVTSDGSWKLGKLDLMTRKNENKTDCDPSDFLDEKGFAILANDILQNATNGRYLGPLMITASKKVQFLVRNHSTRPQRHSVTLLPTTNLMTLESVFCSVQDDIPSVEEFKQLCRSHAASKVSNPQFFRQIFSHSFFTHRFLYIYNFLYNLPAKDEVEKATFFETLADELTAYPQEMVACQLGSLLLSRLVALNSTAEKCLLPRIFTPKNDENSSIFSLSVLKNYVAPRLLNMFLVRDSQIRLLLLKHFKSFYVVFSEEQLQTVILPELLVGIKDMNETLVAETLRTLADLVPVLGAAVVIGKGRAKLFADGRPFVHMMKDACANQAPTTSDLTSVLSPISTASFSLPERLSPDGGEDLEEIIHVHDVLDEEKIDTSSGSIPRKNSLDGLKSSFSSTKNPSLAEVVDIDSFEIKQPRKNKTYTSTRRVEEDLSALDVKCSRSKHDTQCDDIELMFKDMEPIISRTAIMKIPDKDNTTKNKFTVAEVDDYNLDGWGDEIDGDWVGSDPEE